MSAGPNMADTVQMTDCTDEEEEVPKDCFCDPDHPVIVQFQDVSAAAYKIKSGIERSPCTVSRCKK